MVTTKRIGVLMGGSSAEREVSLRSGNAVFQALRELGYDVVALDAGPDVCEMLKKEKVKIVFLTLHGGVGEDGSIQGLLEVLGIPYTGCGVLASALAMDKEASKKMFLFHRIPVPLFSVVAASDADRDFPVRADFPMPWIIKPATEGSSIGVEIVRERSSLGEALKRAGRFGERVIVEQYITGKEIQVGIIDNRVLGSVEVRPHREFYSYEAKYTPGLTDYILPPEIQPEVLRKTEETALAANRALGCSGATRVDLILGNRGDLYVLEVNTIPGMTETSLLPKIAGLSGLSFPSLVEEILRGAVARERNA